MMTRHVLDEYSVTPWPPWAGSVPQEPDPRCVCGGPWIYGGCAMENTIYGRMFSLQEELHAAVEPLRQVFLRLTDALTRSRP